MPVVTKPDGTKKEFAYTEAGVRAAKNFAQGVGGKISTAIKTKRNAIVKKLVKSLTSKKTKGAVGKLKPVKMAMSKAPKIKY